jgi:outer membrane lipoprotein carrier protein
MMGIGDTCRGVALRRPFKAIYYFLLMAFVFVLMSSVSLASSAEDRVTKIQKAYEDIKDIKGSFVQKSYIKDLKRTDSYNGRFLIKPPKMKWEYTGDKAQAIYIRDDEIIIYQKKENQVIKSRFDRATYGQAPIALLAGFGNIRKDFDILPEYTDRLVIKPKSSMGNISRIEIMPADGPFPIKSLVIVDSLSNRIEFLLNDVKVNTGLKNSLFDFTPPKNATLLEY